MRYRRWLPLLAAPLAGLVYLLLPRTLAVNRTSSLPLGLYRLEPAAEPTRGMLVTCCPPAPLAAEALAKGYLGKGSCPAGTEPMFKSVAAVAGDVVEVEAAGVRINGTLVPGTAPLVRDHRGRPLAASRFRASVPAGSVWLLGTHPHSWDSRYYGPLPESSIQHTLRELLVLR